MIRITAALAALLLFVSSAEAHHRHYRPKVVHVALQKTAKPVAVVQSTTHFAGVASWYGGPFIGRRTACGTTFGAYNLTVASPSIKCFSIVQVVNLDNGRRVNATVTDRGPYVGGRILDAGPAVADILKMKGAGTARVDVQILSSP